MNKANTKILKIIGLGIVAGMRATVAPAVLAHFYSKKQKKSLSKSKLSFIQSPAAAIITKVLTTAEITGDKFPNGPDRTTAPQLIARVASGAFAGAVLSTRSKDNMVKGVIIGGTAALAATFGFFYLRKYVGETLSVKEPFPGVAEDILAVGSAILLVKQ